MKIVPYLRFVLIAYLVVNFVSNTMAMGVTDVMVDPILLVTALFYLTFGTYSILIGLQEIRDNVIVRNKYFEYFGLASEVILTIGGAYSVLSYFFWGITEPWRLLIEITWFVIVVSLLITDLKRIRVKNE